MHWHDRDALSLTGYFEKCLSKVRNLWLKLTAEAVNLQYKSLLLHRLSIDRSSKAIMPFLLDKKLEK